MFGDRQQDHRQLLLVDLAVLVVVDASQDRLLEIEQILSVVILQQAKFATEPNPTPATNLLDQLQ
jgi:hypothetical protein